MASVNPDGPRNTPENLFKIRVWDTLEGLHVELLFCLVVPPENEWQIIQLAVFGHHKRYYYQLADAIRMMRFSHYVSSRKLRQIKLFKLPV